MRIIVFSGKLILLSLPIIFMFSGCASNSYKFDLIPLQEAEKQVEIRADSVDIKAIDGSTLYEAIQVTYPGKIIDFAYDPESELLLAKYSTDKDSIRTSENGRFVMFDLKDRKIKWAGQGNPNIEFLGFGKAILRRGPLTIAYRANTGKFPKGTKNSSQIYKNGTVLCMNDDEIRLFDLNKGLNCWEIEGKKATEFYFPQSDEEWLYYIADGLHGVKLSNGQDWHLNESTKRTENGDIIVPTLIANAISIPLGVVMIPTSVPKRMVHNLCSPPHIVGDSIFFAACDQVFCLKRTKGSAIWQASLEQEYELYANQSENSEIKKDLKKRDWQSYMGIWDAGDQIALVGMGYKFIDYAREATSFPYIVLLNRATGKVDNLVALKESEYVMDFLWQANNYYLMTSDHIYTFGSDLKLLNSADKTQEYGELLAFLPSNSNQVLIRYENAVVAYDSFLRALLWHTEINFFDFSRHHDKSAGDKAKKFYLESISIGNSIGQAIKLTSDSIWVSGAAERCLIDISDGGRALARLPLSMVSSRDGYRYGACGRNVLIYKEPQ